MSLPRLSVRTRILFALFVTKVLLVAFGCASLTEHRYHEVEWHMGAEKLKRFECILDPTDEKSGRFICFPPDMEVTLKPTHLL